MEWLNLSTALYNMELGNQWAPLEAKTPPWKHRRANGQCKPNPAETQALKAEREKLAREISTSRCDTSNISNGNISNGAKVITPVPFLKIPEDFGTQSLEEIRRELRISIKPEAKPLIVTIEHKPASNVYVVCPNSYDPDHHTVQVFRAANPAGQMEIVKWTKCTEV